MENTYRQDRKGLHMNKVAHVVLGETRLATMSPVERMRSVSLLEVLRVAGTLLCGWNTIHYI